MLQALSILTFVAAPAWATECAVRAPLSELKTSVEAAETAFARLNRGEVLASTDAARATLPCLSEPMTVEAPGIAEMERSELVVVSMPESVAVPGLKSMPMKVGRLTELTRMVTFVVLFEKKRPTWLA